MEARAEAVATSDPANLTRKAACRKKNLAGSERKEGAFIKKYQSPLQQILCLPTQLTSPMTGFPKSAKDKEASGVIR